MTSWRFTTTGSLESVTDYNNGRILSTVAGLPESVEYRAKRDPLAYLTPTSAPIDRTLSPELWAAVVMMDDLRAAFGRAFLDSEKEWANTPIPKSKKVSSKDVY